MNKKPIAPRKEPAFFSQLKFTEHLLSAGIATIQ